MDFNRDLTREKKIALAEGHKEEYGLNQVLEVLGLPKSIWVYVQRKKAYEEKYRHLRKPLKVVEERIRYYNFVCKHSALGNKAPMKYFNEKGLTL